jgi:hypothetical protein
MSSLPDRRNSPRRNIARNDAWPRSLRVVVAMYAQGPFIAFVFSGSWLALVLTLAMLHWVLRPLKGAWL